MERRVGGSEFYCRGGRDGLSLRKSFVLITEEIYVEKSK